MVVPFGFDFCLLRHWRYFLCSKLLKNDFVICNMYFLGGVVKIEF